MVNYSAALTAVLAAAASVGGADAGLAPRGGIFGLSRRAAGSAAGKSPFGLTTRLATTGGDVAANIPLSIPRGGSPAVIGETDEDRPIDASELYLPGLVGATVAKKTVRAVLHQYRIEFSVVLMDCSIELDMQVYCVRMHISSLTTIIFTFIPAFDRKRNRLPSAPRPTAPYTSPPRRPRSSRSSPVRL